MGVYLNLFEFELMPFTIGRPASILKLPNISRQTVPFRLGIEEQEHVLFYTAKFFEMLRFSKRRNTRSFQTDAKNAKALANAIRAQQFAAHESLFKPIRFTPDELELREYRDRLTTELDSGAGAACGNHDQPHRYQ